MLLRVDAQYVQSHDLASTDGYIWLDDGVD